tara:strand:- start:42 stop:500 length:459 start_codon:yes stop_codon:yes gene_type:complete
VQYPAEWVEGSNPTAEMPSYPLTSRNSTITGSQLTITEPSFAELGLTDLPLDEYADVVISTNKSHVPDLTIITEEYIYLENGAKAKLIVFSSDGAQRVFYRLVYVHNNGIILNFTYAYRPSIENIEPIISYSFNTLQVEVTATEQVSEQFQH